VTQSAEDARNFDTPQKGVGKWEMLGWGKPGWFSSLVFVADCTPRYKASADPTSLVHSAAAAATAVGSHYG